MAGVLAAALLANLALLTHGGLGMSALAGLTGIAAVAAAQSRVLRRYRPSLPTWSWGAAAIASYMAAAIAGVLTLMVPAVLGAIRSAAAPLGTTALPLVTTLATGTMLGVVTGFPPWLVLRRQFAGAGIWMLATAVAAAASSLIPPLDVTVTFFGLPLATFGARVAQGLLTAGTTGAALVRLLHRRTTGDAPLGSRRGSVPSTHAKR